MTDPRLTARALHAAVPGPEGLVVGDRHPGGRP